MHRSRYAFLLFPVALAAVGCGKNDCEDATERITAKYRDCSLDTSTISQPEECTDADGDSAQKLADAVEASTCQNLRDNFGAKSATPSGSDAGAGD